MEFYSKSIGGTQAVSEKRESEFEVHIKSGKKIKVCISQVLKTLQTSKDKVVISGSGPTVTKAITTAEIVKRKIKGLHQQNSLYFTKTEDLWEPKQEGLDQLKVTRNVPSISITLSQKPLDEQTPGYQAPGIHLSLVQFRDEDIALADERLEGNTELRQLTGQHKDNKKQGTKRNRKQTHGKQQQSKKEKTTSEQHSPTEKNNEEKSSREKKDSKKPKYRKPKQSKSTEHENDKI